MHGYNIERGHQCPRCGGTSICTIEDGVCEGQGTCGDCLRDMWDKRMERRYNRDEEYLYE